MKIWVYTSVICSTFIGGVIGAALDHGKAGKWSVVLPVVGVFVGMWIGYKASQYMGH
ncbi:MAG TPA: hypothetical protein VIJ68_02540 [Candidatus Saccharimonadales bacterium]